MKRTLSLRREALAELSTDALRVVVGGLSGPTCRLADCVEDLSEALGCIGTYQCPTRPC